MPLAPAASPADPYASARRQCIDATNGYRARLGLAALSARSDKSACSDVDARGDATNGTVHGASGRCDLSAQNECPGWNGPADKMVAPCLASMFAEGPGEPYAKHGHYINMTSGEYHSLACGFYDKGGQIWMVQNYFR
jgi:hypothetical protein